MKNEPKKQIPAEVLEQRAKAMVEVMRGDNTGMPVPSQLLVFVGLAARHTKNGTEVVFPDSLKPVDKTWALPAA